MIVGHSLAGDGKNKFRIKREEIVKHGEAVGHSFNIKSSNENSKCV